MCQSLPIAEFAKETEVPFRYHLHPKAVLPTFLPDVLPAVSLQDADEKVKFKAAELGAAYAGNYKKLPTRTAGVIWETSHVADADCMLSPLKPKLWTLGSITMEKGKGYILT